MQQNRLFYNIQFFLFSSIIFSFVFCFYKKINIHSYIRKQTNNKTKNPIGKISFRWENFSFVAATKHIFIISTYISTLCNALHNTPTIKTLQFLATLYFSTFCYIYEALLFKQGWQISYILHQFCILYTAVFKSAI